MSLASQAFDLHAACVEAKTPDAQRRCRDLMDQLDAQARTTDSIVGRTLRWRSKANSSIDDVYLAVGETLKSIALAPIEIGGHWVARPRHIETRERSFVTYRLRSLQEQPA